MTVVLDSWAVLRCLEDTDPAAAAVAALLDDEMPLMPWIDLGEVHHVLRAVLDVRLPDESLVLHAARIKADHPMAYADAFAAALAEAQRATLWTGSPELLISDTSWSWRDLRSRHP